VDGESQVIVGQHVSQAANDSQEVKPALEEMEDATGRLPEKLSLDNGYYSGKNLQEVSDGLPVHSFRTLLEDLATIVRNQVVPKIPGARPFTIVTRPIPLRQQVLDRLGVRL